MPHIQTNVCKFGIFQKEIFYLIFIKFLLYKKAYYALVSKLHSCYLICISLLINEEVKQFDINKDLFKCQSSCFATPKRPILTILTRGIVSKETVVLHQWGSETQITSDKGLLSDEGLMLETSAFNLFAVANLP